MFTKKDLIEAIAECEKDPRNYHDCEKLATFYTIFDHLFSQAEPIIRETKEAVVGDYGDTEFLQLIKGKDEKEMWLLVQELLDALQVLNPNLYRSFMAKL